jgi:glycosyltransferase involved in cell wall biosynthesis
MTAPLTCGQRLDRVLQALRGLLDHDPSAMLFVLATVTAETALRREVRSLGRQEHVTFAGPLAGWEAALRAADIFL